ncbi:MAG TPA: GNAT family N-acetyltransferase [Candidatus Acidoferrales bacterium]|nr:GNAT family N-acetyltransferase [Candidatus Acidoferrales bacterium]
MITTERLILRLWKDEDFQPYAEINADPRVREFFPTILTREKSDAEVRHIQSAYARDGFTMFAAELIATGEFIGFIGMVTMTFAVPGLAQPSIEIGWRLAHNHWGKGFATEGALGVIRYGFETVKLKEIVAITVPANVRSRHVMEKIGMKHFPDLDFDHPRIPEGHPLRKHVLYRVKNDVTPEVVIGIFR